MQFFLHWKLHSTTLINNYKMMSNRYTRIFMQHGNKNYLNSLKIMALYILHWTFFDTSICCTAWTSNCRPVNIGRLNAPTQILNWKPWCSLRQLPATTVLSLLKFYTIIFRKCSRRFEYYSSPTTNYRESSINAIFWTLKIYVKRGLR